MKSTFLRLAVVGGVLAAGGAPSLAGAAAQPLRGRITADGSSTVYLITEAMTSAFKRQHPGVESSVGISGTGGGFQKFAAGETDISNASRPIRPAEAEACAKNGIRYVELQVAWDGLAVVIHPENTWARKMTVEQLRKIWHPDTAARKWSDVNPAWPNEEIKLFGAGPASGTFDYFTEVINGREKLSRKDYTASENDEVLVRGVSGDKYALGYFGLAYYEANKGKLGLVAVAAKDGAEFILPTEDTVLKGTYRPLSRPLFIYVKTSSLKRPEIEEFVRFYLRRADIVKESKYISMNSLQQLRERKKFDAALKELGIAPK